MGKKKSAKRKRSIVVRIGDFFRFVLIEDLVITGKSSIKKIIVEVIILVLSGLILELLLAYVFTL